MLPYINTETLDYPLYEPDIRALYPNVSFPTPFVAPVRFAPVYVHDTPTYNRISDGYAPRAPELVDERWEQGYDVFALDPQVAQANLDNEHLELRALIDAEQVRLEAQGEVTYAGIATGIDTDSVNKFLFLAGMAKSAGLESVDVKAKSGWVTLTVADVDAILAAQLTALQAIAANARAHYDRISSLTTASEIDTYRSTTAKQHWE